GLVQTTMNLLVSSVHPYAAGLQGALAEVLLDFGANINGLEENCSPLMTAIQFGYVDTGQMLAQRDARIDTVIAAAAVGRLDLINKFVIDRNTLAPEPEVIAPTWVKIPLDAKGRIEFALAWACKCNHADVADALLAKGVSPDAKDGDNMTALHWASANGMLTTMDKLLDLGASLEVENVWGGTVLDSTVYLAGLRHSATADYPTVVYKLLAAGANIVPVGIMALEKVFAGSNMLPPGITYIKEMFRGQTFTKVERKK
ncbi:MAG: ankyrin repeat domain-containing protein, partial [Gemmatimonadaceae bacterium]